MQYDVLKYEVEQVEDGSEEVLANLSIVFGSLTFSQAFYFGKDIDRLNRKLDNVQALKADVDNEVVSILYVSLVSNKDSFSVISSEVEKLFEDGTFKKVRPYIKASELKEELRNREEYSMIRDIPDDALLYPIFDGETLISVYMVRPDESNSV